VEQHGAGEAYLPVLEALGRIGREPGGEPFVATLQQYAPTWLVQMPALITAAELEALQRRVVGASRERMLREMVEAIEVLTAQRPLVLWFEDLHWADASTVDWLAAIAQQTAPARLFVIGSYRPSDLSLSNHPLRAVKQELVGKGKCKELLIPFLATDHVTQYLTRRYPRHQFPPELSTTIHQSTDGNPLFVVNMVDYLTAQGMIAEVDGRWQLRSRVEDITRSVPDSVRQLIEKQVEQLREEEQLLLEVASVAGVMFSAPAVAAGVEAPVGQVEKACDGLVKRGQFLQTQEPRELPNGTLCGSYGFQHALQHAVVYERTPRLRRLRLHRQIGESQEQQYGKYASLIAAELAMHFERGGDLPRAVQYHQRAGHNALRQHGYQEASNHFRRGLDLLATLPDTAERRQQELALLVALGSPLQAQHGYGAAEVEAVYTRARELSQHIGETAQLFPVLRGLYVFYLLRGKIQTAHELGERLLSLAQRVQDSALLLEAHFAVGQTLLFRGEFIAAQEHFEHGIAIYDPVRHRSHAFLYGHDPGVFCRVLAAWNLCFLGYSDQAVKRNQEALAVAKAVDHPLSVAAAQAFFAMTHQFRREGAPAQAHAEAAVELSAQQGFPYFLAYGTILRGWALVEQGYLQEGIAQLRQGLTSYRATGAELAMTRIVALLAEAWGKSGQPEEGLHTLTEAFTIITSGGERDYEAEIYRLKGELTLQKQFGVRSPKSKEERQKAKGNTQKGDIGIRNWELGFSFLPSPSPNPKSQIRDPASEAGECFLKAIEVARGQQAKSLELRAVMSLVRLRQWQVQSAPRTTQHVPRDRLAEAHRMLSDLYGWFTEGFATKDLQEAKALLDSLKSQKV
jgi:predicted ATPase